MQTPRKKLRRGKKRRLAAAFFAAMLIIFIGASIVIAAGVLYVTLTLQGLPPVPHLKNRVVSQSTKLYDRTGKILLYEIFGEEKRTIVPFEEIPETLKRATLAAEDANFYNQPAFSWRAIARAFLVNLKEGRVVQGGSTITQQLAKNTFLNREKTIARKIKELILAVELESRYSKDEILWLYLNQVAYGSNAYGVEAASELYFGKPVKELTLAESAILAALPKAPSYYSPWGSNKEDLLKRKDHLINRMVELGYITKTTGESAKKTRIVFQPQAISGIKAPHFSLVVKDYLMEKYGEDLVLRGGLNVKTTLDFTMQEIAERVVREGALRNEEKYGGRNAALVAQNPKTGEVLTLVGSRDYFDTEIDGNFNIATQGLRQPGSALKPFVYLTAFKAGYAPKTTVFDVPTEFASGNPKCPRLPSFFNEDKECFHPKNFDEKFRGLVSLEEGLAQSINIPSVKVLYLAGMDNVLKTLAKFGITTLKERGRYGLSLVLGGGEVRLIELVSAYAVLANEGVYHKPALVLSVYDAQGKILEEYQEKGTRVVESEYPRVVNQILSDTQLRAGLFQNSLPLTIFPNHEVALKTGTTNDYRDAWALGYTPTLTIGVWAGNNDNSPMHREGSSILAAVPIWSSFLKVALQNVPSSTFTKPAIELASAKPMLNGQHVFSPTIQNKTYPQIHSILYYVDRKDPLGPVPNEPSEDPQFYNWEEPVIEWAKNNIPNFADYNKPLPGGGLGDATLIAPQEITITNTKPESGAQVTTPLRISAEVSSRVSIKRVELYVNRELVKSESVSSSFYKLEYLYTKPLNNQNLIEIKAFNESGKKFTYSIIVFQ